MSKSHTDNHVENTKITNVKIPNKTVDLKPHADNSYRR